MNGTYSLYERLNLIEIHHYPYLAAFRQQMPATAVERIDTERHPGALHRITHDVAEQLAAAYDPGALWARASRSLHAHRSVCQWLEVKGLWPQRHAC